MSILLLLVPLSVVLLGIAVWAFVWAVKRGQFDDLDTPALDILVDDDQVPPLPASQSERDDNAA
ncbi:MAG TPA: cbb3-type cytochrome oxidase assembly protein CcoS [Lysobacter sp.]|nr:cbb3-type cytochrome oxidase assembly protein CcoS [Lysobacter sp.]